MKETISSCCSPRHLHYSALCCRCLATLLAIPHFVPIIHMVWLFDMRENWQITGWRAVTSQINVVTGAHENLGVWAVLLLGGLGRAKTNIIPTCCGLTLLAQTPVIDTHFCCRNHSRGAALGGQIPSLPLLCPSFPACCFVFLHPPSHLHQTPGGFIVFGTTPFLTPPSQPISCQAVFVSSTQTGSRVQQASCLVLLAEMTDHWSTCRCYCYCSWPG